MDSRRFAMAHNKLFYSQNKFSYRREQIAMSERPHKRFYMSMAIDNGTLGRHLINVKLHHIFVTFR